MTANETIKKIDPSSVLPMPDGAGDAGGSQQGFVNATAMANVGPSAPSRGVGNTMRCCPYCDEKTLAVAKKCRHCGELLDVSKMARRQGTQRLPVSAPRELAPHRGGLILTLGILSFFCFGIILGPAAWVMARHDLVEMEQGRMDPAGQSMTQAGKVCGMIVTIGVISMLSLFVCLAITAGFTS